MVKLKLPILSLRPTSIHPLVASKRTLSQKAADWLTAGMGSWTFILFFMVVLVFWMFLNTSWLLFGQKWDPYPFILLNLALSCLAAIQAPIIMMSQNRQSQKDRARAEYDYAVNRKAEREIKQVQKQLIEIEKKLFKKKK